MSAIYGRRDIQRAYSYSSTIPSTSNFKSLRSWLTVNLFSFLKNEKNCCCWTHFRGVRDGCFAPNFLPPAAPPTATAVLTSRRKTQQPIRVCVPSVLVTNRVYSTQHYCCDSCTCSCVQQYDLFYLLIDAVKYFTPLRRSNQPPRFPLLLVSFCIGCDALRVENHRNHRQTHWMEYRNSRTWRITRASTRSTTSTSNEIGTWWPCNETKRRRELKRLFV